MRQQTVKQESDAGGKRPANHRHCMRFNASRVEFTSGRLQRLATTSSLAARTPRSAICHDGTFPRRVSCSVAHFAAGSSAATMLVRERTVICYCCCRRHYSARPLSHRISCLSPVGWNSALLSRRLVACQVDSAHWQHSIRMTLVWLVPIPSSS